MRNAGFLNQLKLWALVLTCLCVGVPLVQAKDSLDWQQEKNTVAAEITSWDLAELLENIASVTGWQIYVEPDTKHPVSTKFKNRTPGDALRLLLGDLSFALLPQKNAPSRLYVFRTTLQEATQLVKVPQKPATKVTKPIPDELIITVKPGTDIEALAKKLGAKVIGKLDGLNTYRLKFEDAESANEAKEQLRTDSSVESVENNYPITRPEQPDMLKAGAGSPINLTPKVVPDANRIVVALIDTAVQPKGTGLDGFFLAPISVNGDFQPGADEPTHGTSMSEAIARGMTASMDGKPESKVRFLSVDVYGRNPTTSTFEVGQGILEALKYNPSIINMSLGSYADSPMLQTIIESAHKQNVLFFASAGNDPVPNPTFPAAFPDVIAVTAADPVSSDRNSFRLAPYANYGSFVDVFAPGRYIVNFNNRSWMVTGTSGSSAYMAGIAAGMLDSGGRTSSQVEAVIRSSFRFNSPR
ncbi:MAG: Thermophilic serine proteinase [Verrucomicrobiales bacterium]|nr:Thermophilic serine proteinase [Verrucomicrobiales bacterium]